MMSTVDLRCDGNLFGRLTDNRWLEVKCKRRGCGYAKGTVILHTIDISTGQVVKTKSFAEPRNRRSGNASHNASAAVRSA